jgi:hypothetical protein
MAQNGIDALNTRRTRRARQAPPSRHPATPAALSVVPDKIDDTAEPPAPPSSQPASASKTPVQSATPATQEPTSAEPSPTVGETERGGTAPAAELPPAAAIAPPKPRTTQTGPAGLPDLDIDLNDPDAHIPAPTVMSVPESIVARFNSARATAPSHTAIVLNALREHAHELPTLILARRPGPTPGDLFPWRRAPGKSTETPLPLRIRPTKAERKVMKALETWASQQIRLQRPGAPETNRSEMVAAALDAYLPSS